MRGCYTTGGREFHSPRDIAMPDTPADPALPDFSAGSVWLVGAGPGDPGLLTLLALHALRQADVIVYDALVDRRVLALGRPGVALDYAGKRGGRPSAQQEDISLKLIRLAQAGKRVLRLKGGDPMVFGRGGEEAIALRAAGISFRIVPGITAGIGGLAYAGIPATHRDVNVSIAFVSGHASGGELPRDVDWPALSRAAPTLVIYMAIGHLAEIAQQLMAAGRGGDEPAALVSKASLPDQRVLESTLAHIAADADAAKIEAPAMLVVGPAVALREKMDWFRP
jgi:uroporphyrin-III C-methyltransferase